MGWNGCLISRIARPSNMSVARTRCRSVCAKDHSPPTGTSTAPAGIAAARSSVAGHVRSSAAQAAQAIRICGAPVGATGETAVEFGVNERSHIDAVDAQGAFAIQEPRCVDVSSLHIDATHHDTG